MKHTPENHTPIELLTGVQKLGWIINKTRQISVVNQWLGNNLSPELSKHSLCIAVHTQHLVLTVSSPCWAHQLRMQSTLIVDQLKSEHNEFNYLRSIKVKIAKN